MTTATVTPIRRNALHDSRNTGVNFKAGATKKAAAWTAAVPADAAATTVTVALMLADAVTVTVAEWDDVDYVICETHGDITTLAADLGRVAGVTRPEHQYFGMVTCTTDGEDTKHAVRIAIQQVETATTTRLLVTMSAFDTRAMIWTAAVDVADLEG